VARAVQNAITLVAPRAAAPHWLPLAFGALSFLPVAGLPLGRWLHGLNGGFSIPFAALLLDFTITPLIRRPLLPPAANRAAVWFGFVAGWLLYPAALGLGPYDPYVLGWRSPGVATAAAILGAGLTLRHSAFGVVLLSAGLLWQLGCLESDNAWDYLVDPIYWVVANGNLIAGWVAQPLRRLRGSFFQPDLFADPAWDILLDLKAAAQEGQQVSVSSLCIAAAVPPTTALRWITAMAEIGMLERRQDPADARRVFIELSGETSAKLDDYFAALATRSAPMI